MKKEYDWMEEARGLAAQCWCDPENAAKAMDHELAESVARRIAAWMRTGAQHDPHKIHPRFND